MIRFFLLFSIITLFQGITEAQKINDGLYVNIKSKEFLYIYNDSIQFRLCNYDGLASYSICKGYYKYNGKSKYYVYQSEHTKEQTSVIEKIRRTDSLISFSIKDKSNEPYVYTYIHINEINILKKKSEIFVGTDTNGEILLSESQINRLNSKEISLKLINLDFTTERRVLLERGYEYAIKPVMCFKCPFVIYMNGEISINSLNAQEIEVDLNESAWDRERFGTSKLRKADIKQHFDFLLDKDVTDIIK